MVIVFFLPPIIPDFYPIADSFDRLLERSIAFSETDIIFPSITTKFFTDTWSFKVRSISCMI